MIVPTEGFVEVGTLVEGSVSRVFVSPGDPVQAGQAVASLTTPAGVAEDIVAPVDGSVATIVVRQGGTTEPGTPLLTLDPDDGGDVAVAFLPAEQGAQVRVGMPALVAVSALPQAQYGYLTGTVSAVALLPVTADRVRLLTGGNDTLPEFFLSAGPVVEVTVTLDADPETPSGYAWTTGEGPDAQVATGTLTRVSIVVSDTSPLERITG
jgi:multidrug resistance efflux pump